MPQNKPDFQVKYHLYSENQGGRKVTYQHLRCDFAYKDDDIKQTGIYMIHPEFLDDMGNPLGKNIPVPLNGRASMRILSCEMREKIHKNRIKIGIRGYFMEGSRPIGEVVVDEILGLDENCL
ncbi:MAG: hypothetical protein WBG70_24645 [Spirulinaceae cyanobacterium]